MRNHFNLILHPQFTRRVSSACSTASSIPLTNNIVLPKKWRKPRAEGDSEDYFVDYKRIHISGGNGGCGVISFARIWCNPYAGPDGSDGGNGGHVIFQACPSIKSLSHLEDKYEGNGGNHGTSYNMTGKSAVHKYIKVPIGTLFRLADTPEVLADLKRPNDIFLAARGGAGGRGNYRFLSNANRAPLCAEMGGQGEQVEYDVELRVMAHCGLVGFPNAGKSTLLRAVSRARPKVACFPFTTVNPMVGIIEYEDFEQLSIADIPGLLPGFDDNNYGTGTSFLRHIERCLCLFYVIDLSIDEPWIQLYELQDQLEQHKIGLSTRPYAIVANKIDQSKAEKNLELFRQKTNLPIFAISAKYRMGLEPLLIDFKQIYDKHKKQWEIDQ